MRAGTHLAFAGLLGVGAAGFGAEVTLGSGAALALGALLPDIDTRRSQAGRVAGRAAVWLERRFGHRTLTHSLLGLAGVGVLASPLLLIQRDPWLALVSGYASHLLLDTANVSGVPLLWPHRVRFWLVGNRAWRVPYGGPRERAWFAAIAVTGLALAPLTLDGFTPWFHRALGTGYGAVEDYLRWKDTREVWAHIRGANLVTGERIDGRYRVVDALHTEMLLVEDEDGRPYAVGLGQQATITIGRVQVWPGAERRIVTQQVEVRGTIGELLARLPAGAAQVHVTGTLRTPDAVEPEPVVGRYRRVRVLGDTLELRSVTPQELAPLAWVWIDEGSVLVRASYGMDVAIEPPLAGEAIGERFVLTLADLPDLSAIQVEVGQQVQVGDLIAHYPEGAAVAAARQALEDAHTHCAELAEALERLDSDMSNDRQRRLSELDAARQTLDRTTLLVARDALPLSAEREAMEDLIAAERALADHDLAAARRLRAIELDSEAAAERILALEERLARELSALEIRAVMAGTISAIRITGSDRRGVDAEVILIVAGGGSE